MHICSYYNILRLFPEKEQIKKITKTYEKLITTFITIRNMKENKYVFDKIFPRSVIHNKFHSLKNFWPI